MELSSMNYACHPHGSHFTASTHKPFPLRIDPRATLKPCNLPSLKVFAIAPENEAARSSRAVNERERRPAAKDCDSPKIEMNGKTLNHVNGAVAHLASPKLVLPVVDAHEALNEKKTMVEGGLPQQEQGLKLALKPTNSCNVQPSSSSYIGSSLDLQAQLREAAIGSAQDESTNGYLRLRQGLYTHSHHPPASNPGLGIVGFLKGKRILITGATGFLAKVLVEKILRVQPDVGHLFLLIKAQDASHAKERMQHEIAQATLFENLQKTHGSSYQKFIESKISTIVGDIGEDNLGMDVNMVNEIQGKVDIIINSAASTTFDERYDHALNLNTKGPQRVTKFANLCPKLQLLMHVSTAFVNGERQGIVKEKAFKIGCSIANESTVKGQDMVPDIDVDKELQLVKTKLYELSHGRKMDPSLESNSLDEKYMEREVHQVMKDLGMERAKKYGWQDTYVFTKALGEMLVDSTRNQMPVVIIRPSVVESSFRDPFPGWMEGNRMMDPIIISYGKGQLPGFLVDPKSVLDVVPVDMVANAMLAAMAFHANNSGLEVYQVASSVLNPLVFSELARMSREHFEDRPFVDKFGKPLPIAKLELFDTMEGFMDAVTTCPQILQVSGKGSTSFPCEKLILRHKQLTLRVKEQAAYLANLYRPYTFYGGRFDTTKTQKLLDNLSSEEKELFGFDVGEIDWDNYIKTIHIPGLRKHVLKGRGSNI